MLSEAIRLAYIFFLIFYQFWKLNQYFKAWISRFLKAWLLERRKEQVVVKDKILVIWNSYEILTDLTLNFSLFYANLAAFAFGFFNIVKILHEFDA